MTNPDTSVKQGRIIIVRHGRPALSRSVLLSAEDYGRWWAKYDESGLRDDQSPPQRLKELADQSATVLSSTMPRAIETAQLLVAQRLTVTAQPLYVEAPLPVPPWFSWIKLSPRIWGVISRLHWLLGYAPDGMERREETWARVDRIIDELQTHTAKGDVMLCAHGYLNWIISRRMNDRGWHCVEHQGGNKYWSRRIYERNVN